MSKQHTSKSTLFLMELIIVIFFFSICSAICVNIFGSAQQMSRDSHNLSNAIMVARSAASCYKSAEGDVSKTMSLLNGQSTGDNAIIHYDQQWQQTNQQDQKGFYLEIKSLEHNGEAAITVLQQKDDEVLFQLNVKTGRGGGQHGT